MNPDLQNYKIQPQKSHRMLIVLSSLLLALAYAILNIVISLPLESKTGCQGPFEPNKTMSLIANNLIVLVINFVLLLIVISIATALWKRSKILALLSVPVTFTILYFVSTVIELFLLGSNPCL